MSLIALLTAACGGGPGVYPGQQASTSPGGVGTTGGGSVTGPGALNLCGIETTTAEMVAKINAVRRVGKNCGGQFFPAAAPLAWNDKLAQAAAVHAIFTADAVAAGGDLSHTGAGGTQPGDRVDATGYNWRSVGENLAGGQGGVDEALVTWIGSPVHCANLMSTRFVDYGFACAVHPSSRYRTHWVQVFARPF